MTLLDSEATLPDSEATWEKAVAFAEAYPHFNLEDKVVLEEPGIDTSSPSEAVQANDVGP